MLRGNAVSSFMFYYAFDRMLRRRQKHEIINEKLFILRSNLPMLKSVTIMIGGKVQGIGFRYFVQQIGNQMKLSGWVRNYEKDVQIYAEGAQEELEAFIEKVKAGTPLSIISYCNCEFKDIKEKKYQIFNVTF